MIPLAQLLLGPIVTVAIATSPCPDYPLDNGGFSCYHPDTQTVYIPHYDRFTFLHEIGHAYDFQILTDEDRARIQPMLQQSTGPWEGGTFYGPDEEFASDFAYCEMGYEYANRAVCAYVQNFPVNVQVTGIS